MKWGWLLFGALAAVLAGFVATHLGPSRDHVAPGRTNLVHWDKPALVRGRTIHLTFDGGSCDEKRWVVVKEARTRVTLTVKEREHGGLCGGTGVGGLHLDATLAKPLGARLLIDGACLGGDEPLRGNCRRAVDVCRWVAPSNRVSGTGSTTARCRRGR